MNDFMNKFDKLNEYIISDENRKKCEPYFKNCERFSAIAKKFAPDCKSIYENISKKAVETEYSVGGETVFRGFYCPNPVEDIITCNCSRGKLYKRKSLRTKPTYKYGFDIHENLVFVNHIRLNCLEFIINQDNISLGIMFSDFNGKVEVHTVTECTYDAKGQIISYIRAQMNGDLTVSELELMKFDYDMSGLRSANLCDFNPSMPTVNEYLFTFNHDKNGFLSEYSSVASFFTDNSEFLKYDQVHKIKIKRKV